jgi:hypothetical protein
MALLLGDCLQSCLSQWYLVLKLPLESSNFHLHLFVFLFQNLNSRMFFQGLLQYFF